MRLRAVIQGVLAGGIVLTLNAATNAQGCNFSGNELNCGNRQSDIVTKLADQTTADIYENPHQLMANFTKPPQVEEYRRSVDRNWRAVNRTERISRRKMKQRRLSIDAFEQWRTVYAAAQQNYSKAMHFYRLLIWHGKAD
ncbi:MAG: hypothetical protein AAF217_13125 [Pseudomonadota bacterium]